MPLELLMLQLLEQPGQLGQAGRVGADLVYRGLSIRGFGTWYVVYRYIHVITLCTFMYICITLYAYYLHRY